MRAACVLSRLHRSIELGHYVGFRLDDVKRVKRYFADDGLGAKKTHQQISIATLEHTSQNKCIRIRPWPPLSDSRTGVSRRNLRMSLSPRLPSFGHTRPTKTAFFPTKKAAERHAAETSVKVSRGEYLERSQVPTFAAIAEQSMKSKRDRRPSYTEGLHSRLKKCLMPQFGRLRLDQVTVTRIEKLRDTPHEQGRSPVTINGIIRMIRGIYKMAIRRGLCTINPPIVSNAPTRATPK